MSASFHIRVWSTTGLLGLLLLTGCGNFKQPGTDAPHAVVVGTYLGGQQDKASGYYAFGYTPGVTVCKGTKSRDKCSKYVPGTLEGRDLTFRIPAAQELTINPVALVASSYKNDGVTATTTKTYCYGDPKTVTAKAGERYHFFYAYDASVPGCGAKWEGP